MAAIVKIDDDIAEVLRGGSWQDHVYLLPPGQLDRPVYERVNKVLLALGGKWNRSAKGHVFAAAAHDELVAALDNGHAIDSKRQLEQFFTPVDIADRMFQLANIQAGQRVLEPSAGDGRLLWQALDARAIVDAVEIDPKLVDQLKATRKRAPQHRLSVYEGDFMTWEPPVGRQHGYDRVIMNPPFSKCQDIKHVTRAFGFLRPGGKLVSLMSPHWTFADDKASVGFRDLVRRVDGGWEALPAGSFDEEGTGVSVGILVAKKRGK